ncbi:MAG: membrane dipeptidase [Pseudomonadota bacterium]
MRILKRIFWTTAVVLSFLVVAFFIFAPGLVERGANRVAAHDPYPVSESARVLHGSMVVGDWHADSLLWNRDLTERGRRGHLDLPRMIEGNLGLQVFSAVTKSPAGQNYQENSAEAPDTITLLAAGQLWPIKTWRSLTERALYQAAKLRTVAERSKGRLRVVTTRAELDAVLSARARGETVVGGILGIEGGHALEGQMANLDRLDAAGFRVIGLQHFFDNALGGSLHGIGNRGLTEFGRQVVAEIDRRGMVLDLAHSSPRVAAEVLAMVDMPVVVSHTGIHSHTPVRRNFEDVIMRAVARRGGVVAIGFWADVTGDASPAGVADAIRHAITVVGEDHVSLGSDYDGAVPVAFDASELAALTHALLEAGVTEPQIRKVMGENMVRVLRARLP